MNPKIAALLFPIFTMAVYAEPFRSGTSMPSAGRGVRVPTGEKSAPSPKPAPNAPAKSETKSLIQLHAENYFLKQWVPGPAGMRVMSASATANDPAEMPGWPGKSRVTGQVAVVVTYKGKDQSQTHPFEAIIENGAIAEFTAR